MLRLPRTFSCRHLHESITTSFSSLLKCHLPGEGPGLLLKGTKPSLGSRRPITALFSPRLSPPQDVICVCVCVCVCVCSVTRSCLTLGYPADGSPPGSSLHGIFHTGILSGLPFPPPGNLPISGIKPAPPVLAGGFFAACHLGSARLFFGCLAGVLLPHEA